MAEEKPYTEAVKSGQYAKRTGLTGKYDNVRRFWEDESVRIQIKPFLKELAERKVRRLERLKILDLGCGSGDGYDLLMGVTAEEKGIYESAINLIDQKLLDLYLGIDINRDLLAQAKEYLGSNKKLIFQEADFSKGLPIKEDFDIYLASYGTLSHNHDEQTVNLLTEIATYSKEHALIICDWLGRYSCEWQDLWVGEPGEETFMNYRISYVYPAEKRDKLEIQSFPLRIISRDEVLRIVEEASKRSSCQIKLRSLFDRSIFVGRHMDTAEYNRFCPPMRQAVNSLLEPNIRTDLSSLFIDYIPKQGFSELNQFFEGFSMCWNTLIQHTIGFISEFQEGLGRSDALITACAFYPEALKLAVNTMKGVIDVTGNFLGDVRANIIEPQLAYALRRLEMDMQIGIGAGHGLVGVFEIKKSSNCSAK